MMFGDYVVCSALFLALSVGSAHAATVACSNGVAVAHGADAAQLEAVCDATDVAIAQFKTCGLSPPEHLNIHVRDEIEASCLGVFHCGTDNIDILAPTAMLELRNKAGSFAHLEADHLFRSVVVHEFAHAAYDATPCPFDQCVATSEYFAYAVQLLTLSTEDRAPIAAAAAQKPDINHGSINAFLLFMSPEIFVTNVWGHFSARPDQCAYLRSLQEGWTQFDRFHP